MEIFFFPRLPGGTSMNALISLVCLPTAEQVPEFQVWEDLPPQGHTAAVFQEVHGGRQWCCLRASVLHRVPHRPAIFTALLRPDPPSTPKPPTITEASVTYQCQRRTPTKPTAHPGGSRKRKELKSGSRQDLHGQCLNSAVPSPFASQDSKGEELRGWETGQK